MAESRKFHLTFVAPVKNQPTDLSSPMRKYSRSVTLMQSTQVAEHLKALWIHSHFGFCRGLTYIREILETEEHKRKKTDSELSLQSHLTCSLSLLSWICSVDIISKLANVGLCAGCGLGEGGHTAISQSLHALCPSPPDS